jgi:hypothetical protein
MPMTRVALVVAALMIAQTAAMAQAAKTLDI